MKQMAIDPLSPSTRIAKRNLLAVSILAITYKAFNITIENIPIAGLNIRFDRGAFAFLLLCGASYFGLTFLFYYLIDIWNIEETPHQQNVRQRFDNRISSFRTRCVQLLNQEVIECLSDPFYLSGLSPGSMNRLLEQCERKNFDIDEAALKLGTPQSILNIGSRNIGGGNALNPASYREVYEAPIKITIKHLKDYRRDVRRYRFFLLPWMTSVKLMYATRNLGLDGILPIALAILAIVAMYDLVSVHWITWLLPSSVKQ